MLSFGNVANDLYGELGEAILHRVPAKLQRLIPLLPDEVSLLANIGWKAMQAGQREPALALYDRMVALPVPAEDDARLEYLRIVNNACIQLHAVRLYDVATRLADRALPVGHELPALYHAAACAYVGAGDHAKAFELVKLAMQHDYDQLARLETDPDLGPLLEKPEWQALFRDWHARQEGN
jgi:hypothetical protein